MKFAVILISLVLAACQTLPSGEPAAPAERAVEAAPTLPFAESRPVDVELDSDLLYSFLVAEVGAHRGDLELALSHYLNAALIGYSSYAAERATRIALHLGDTTRGLRAVRRWVELEPNSRQARLFAAVLFMYDGQDEDALEQMEAVVRIADARGRDGFLQVAATLGTESKHRDDARRLLRTLVERHAQSAQAQHALGVAFAAWRELDAAEAALRRAIALQPDWDQPHILLVRVLGSEDRRDDAVKHMAAVVKEYPDSEKLRTTYARLLVDALDYQGALRQFAILHRAHPDNDDIAYGYALLASQQRQWDVARGIWQSLRNLRQRRDEATYYLAQVEEATDHTELAIGLYGDVDSAEYRIDAQLRRSVLLAETGRLVQARAELRDARIAHPGQAVALYLAETRILQDAGENAAAFALYEDALQARPEAHDLLYNRALFKGDLGDFDGLEQDLRLLLERDPDNADALNALGYTLADRNRQLDEAYSLVAHAMRLKPDNAAVMDSMGWVLYRRGEYAQAVKFLRSALERLQDDEIAAHLGEVLWASGQHDEARRVWREALDQAPQSDILQAVMERFPQ